MSANTNTVSGGKCIAALEALMADPATSYRLRQLIREDEVLQRAAVLADDELLLRLDALVRDDAEAQGPRDVPQGRVLPTGLGSKRWSGCSGDFEPSRELALISIGIDGDSRGWELTCAPSSAGYAPSPDAADTLTVVA